MQKITRFLRLSGGDIAYWDNQSDGLPLLLLHGSGASKRVFERQFTDPSLSAFRLIALDLPGHGESSDALHPRQYSLPSISETIFQAIQKLDLKRVAILGWSLAGHVAMELLATAPGISGIMVCGAPPLPERTVRASTGLQHRLGSAAGLENFISELEAKRFARLCFGDFTTPALISDVVRSDGRCRSEFFKSLFRGEERDELRALQDSEVPFAVVNGASDPIVRSSYLRNLPTEKLWMSQPIFLSGAGHSPFLQSAEEFNPLVARFMLDAHKTQSRAEEDGNARLRA